MEGGPKPHCCLTEDKS
ncbi:mCG1045421 [Mus musculus]|nr:mCG1045421 [Mus musculus]